MPFHYNQVSLQDIQVWERVVKGCIPNPIGLNSKIEPQPSKTFCLGSNSRFKIDKIGPQSRKWESPKSLTFSEMLGNPMAGLDS